MALKTINNVQPYIIDITYEEEANGDTLNAWICHKDYGIKMHCLSKLTKETSLKEFEETVRENFFNYVFAYSKMYEKI